MKKKLRSGQTAYDAVVFLPAITPLEAAVLPAMERSSYYGTLRMIRRACGAGEPQPAQRAKIWVR